MIRNTTNYLSLSRTLAHTHSLTSLAQALVELQETTDIRQVLRDVFFLGAREVEAVGKKAICVYVPVPQQQQFQKIQVCLFVDLFVC